MLLTLTAYASQVANLTQLSLLPRTSEIQEHLQSFTVPRRRITRSDGRSTNHGRDAMPEYNRDNLHARRLRAPQSPMPLTAQPRARSPAACLGTLRWQMH